MEKILTEINQFMSLERAKELIANFQRYHKLKKQESGNGAVIPICETFDSTCFESVLNQDDCVAVRIYFGMDEDLKVQLVIVGVTEEGQDIVPLSLGIVTQQGLELMTEGEIVGNGIRCPEDNPAPPSSALNS